MSKPLITVFFFLLVFLNVGCSSLRAFVPGSVASAPSVEFAIDDIKAVGQAKDVSIGGKASLPDGTQLAVSAIRVLAEPAVSDRAINEPIYAILDRQFVTVQGDRWQANLELQEADINGSLFENWQLDSALLKDELSPDSRVLFLLTLEPTGVSETIQQILLDSTINDGDTQLTYTSSGQPYLQVEQAVAIAVPSGNPAEAQQESTPVNYSQAWQSRSNYRPEVDALGDASRIPFSEDDNLPLPASNMLQ